MPARHSAGVWTNVNATLWRSSTEEEFWVALIEKFELRPIEPHRVHGGVICGYASSRVGGHLILQLETYGSTERKIPGKVSQSIQLDEAAAAELKAIIDRTFPGH